MALKLEPMTVYEVPKPVKLAEYFGLIHDGWSLEEYLIESILTESGYDTVIIWGVQGCGKSTFMLTILYWVERALYIIANGLTQWTFDDIRKLIDEERYDDFPAIVDEIQDLELPERIEIEIWELVLSLIVFKPGEFTDALEGVDEYDIQHARGWDDIGVHYPSSRFKTDLEQYEGVDSTFAAIRTKCHLLLATIPIVDRLAKNIKDNVTIEIFIGKNQRRLINRCFHLPSQRSLESNFFKVILEEPTKIDKYFVPLWVWEKYWQMRLKLTREALAALKRVTRDIDVNDYIPVVDAAEIAFGQGVKYAPSTIQQDISRSIIQGEKIGGVLCVHTDDFFRILEIKGGERIDI